MRLEGRAGRGRGGVWLGSPCLRPFPPTLASPSRPCSPAPLFLIYTQTSFPNREINTTFTDFGLSVFFNAAPRQNRG